MYVLVRPVLFALTDRFPIFFHSAQQRYVFQPGVLPVAERHSGR